jgi:hypothetical protein
MSISERNRGEDRGGGEPETSVGVVTLIFPKTVSCGDLDEKATTISIGDDPNKTCQLLTMKLPPSTDFGKANSSTRALVHPNQRHWRGGAERLGAQLPKV